MPSARILMLDAGGTIAQVWDEDRKVYKYLDPSRCFDWLRDTERSVFERFATIEYLPARGCSGDSSARRAADWGRLAEQLFQLKDNYDGFVITHGSATLAYAGSLMSFMLADLHKAVILTAAQIPVRGAQGPLLSDGFINLASSVRVAAAGVVEDIAIVFGESVLKGNRARKLLSFGRNAFYSPNMRPLARIDALGIAYQPQPARPKPITLVDGSRFRCVEGVSPISVHPALAENFHIEDAATAVVVGGYLSGIIPESIRSELARVARERLVVVYGTTAMGFDNEPEAIRATTTSMGKDILWARDMTFEAVLMKASWVLAQEGTLEGQRNLMMTNVAGEFTGP